MTLVFEHPTPDPAARRTHVLLIGAGAYPALLGGAAASQLEDPIGMRQLTCPPHSVHALADWFLGSGKEGSRAFYNPTAPLGSLHMLLGPEQTYTTPAGEEIEIEDATRAAITRAFNAWASHGKSGTDHVFVFYYCGHGFAGATDCIMPSDFGVENPANPWASGLDIRTTASAFRTLYPGQHYFFIDACRSRMWSALQPGAAPQAILPIDPDVPSRAEAFLVLNSIVSGGTAHGPQHNPSFFATALLEALRGHEATASDEDDTWCVTGHVLISVVADLLAAHNQEPEAKLAIGSSVLQYLTEPPKFIVERRALRPQTDPRDALTPHLNTVSDLPEARCIQLGEALAAADGELGDDLNSAAREVYQYFEVVLPAYLRWRADKAPIINKRLRFKIVDKDTWSWTLNLRPPSASVERGYRGHAAMEIALPLAVMHDTLTGAGSIVAAYNAGDVSIAGDPNLLEVVGHFLTGKDGEEVPSP